MEFFAKIVNNFQSLTIFAKSSILDVGQSLEYACLLSRLLILNWYLFAVAVNERDSNKAIKSNTDKKKIVDFLNFFSPPAF